jgi:hypothetical protein
MKMSGISVVDRDELAKASLNFVEKAKRKALEIESKLSGITITEDSKESLTHMPYGFDVNKAKREFLQERNFMLYLNNVGQHASLAMEKCKSIGVPVIAVLPEKVWQKVYKDARLFDLWPKENGDIYVSTITRDEVISNAMDKVKTKRFFGSRKNYDLLKYQKALAKRKALIDFFKGRDNFSLMLDLFPNQTSEDDSNYYNRDCTTISFPEPDVDFGRALLILKKNRIQPGFTLEADAIYLDDYGDSLIRECDEEINRSVKQKEERKLKANVNELDPILSFRYETVRVLVAQYGDWPLELKAIRAALEEDLRMPI